MSAFAPLRALAAALALGLALPACATPAAPAAPAAPETSPELRFVTCPVYRNTDAGRKSGCWLADSPEDGLRYDVTRSPTKPDWNRAVLVEGRVSAGQTDTCGGIVLEPVRVSVLAQACPRAMLPAQGYPGVRFQLPARNIRPIHEPRELPARPYAERTFGVWFDHGRDFIVYQLSDYFTHMASLYALDIDASRVEITGWSVTTPETVSGHVLVEDAMLARRRADAVANWLRMMGVPAERIVVRVAHDGSTSTLEGSDGLLSPSRRRVEVRVIP